MSRVIYRPSRTLIHKNLQNFQNYTKIYREMVLKDCKVQVFSQNFKQSVQDCKELQAPRRDMSSWIRHILQKISNLLIHIDKGGRIKHA